jgi:hypothetical protein
VEDAGLEIDEPGDQLLIGRRQNLQLCDVVVDDSGRKLVHGRAGVIVALALNDGTYVPDRSDKLCVTSPLKQMNRIGGGALGQSTSTSGARRAVVVTDVAHEVPVQILGAGEDAAGDHVALDAGEPVSTWFSHDEYVGV